MIIFLIQQFFDHFTQLSIFFGFLVIQHHSHLVPDIFHFVFETQNWIVRFVVNIFSLNIHRLNRIMIVMIFIWIIDAMWATNLINDFRLMNFLIILLTLNCFEHFVKNIFQKFSVFFASLKMFFNLLIFRFYYFIKFVHVTLILCLSPSLPSDWLLYHISLLHNFSLEIGHFQQRINQFQIIFRFNQAVD